MLIYGHQPTRTIHLVAADADWRQPARGDTDAKYFKRGQMTSTVHDRVKLKKSEARNILIALFNNMQQDIYKIPPQNTRLTMDPPDCPPDPQYSIHSSTSYTEDPANASAADSTPFPPVAGCTRDSRAMRTQHGNV